MYLCEGDYNAMALDLLVPNKSINNNDKRKQVLICVNLTAHFHVMFKFPINSDFDI